MLNPPSNLFRSEEKSLRKLDHCDINSYFYDKCRMSVKKENNVTVREPAVAYRSATDRYTDLLSVLGGSETINNMVTNDMDLILLTRSGLPKKSLDTLSAKLGISMEGLSQLLNISLRTLQRKEPTDKLSIHVSEHMLAIAEVILRGTEVMGSQQSLETWLHSALTSFNDLKPIDIMDTSIGTQLILNTLGRIEHGVY